MRHVYFRSILSLVWVMVGIVTAVSGNVVMAAFDLAIGGLCLHSAHSMWKKEKNRRGEE